MQQMQKPLNLELAFAYNMIRYNNIQNIKFKVLPTLLRKRIAFLYSFILVLSLSCDTEDGFDCLQTDGDIISRTLDLAPFTRIQFEDDIRVELRQGDTQEVILETGENLLSDLNIFVNNGVLIAQNENGCNIFREFGVTILHITAPNITDIRNASAFEIRSVGTLNYPNLRLESTVRPNLDDPNKVGDFFLNIASENLQIIANGMSRFFISGSTDTANVNFSDEFPLLEAEDLVIQELTFRQVSSAPMRVNPQQSIIGSILGVGDVIAVNQPPIVDVVELSVGRLIFD